MSEGHPDYSRDLGCGEHIRAMRDHLFQQLGYIVVAEKHLPPLITNGLYDRNLDRYRELTNIAIEQASRDGFSKVGDIEIKFEEGGQSA